MSRRFLIAMLSLSFGCGPRMLGVRSFVERPIDLTAYGKIAVLPAASKSAERTLADSFVSEFNEIGVQSLTLARLQEMAGKEKIRVPRAFDKVWARDLGRKGDLQALGFVSLKYHNAVASIELNLFEVDTGEKILKSTGRYDSGMAGWGIEHRKIVRSMIEDIKAKMFHGR